MYKRRKKINKKKIGIIIFIIIAIIFGLIANIFNTERNLTVFEKAIKDSVISIEKIIGYPVNFISKKIIENKDKDDLYEKYKNVLLENETLKNTKNQNEELKKQINELKALLNINNILSDYTYLNATVISRDLNNWNNTITIDKGESSGVTIDMPVVINEGLIGKVVKTSSFTSTVRLLKANNTNDKISVKIKNGNEYIYGILNGYDDSNNTYIIEGITQNVDVQLNSIVTTTGIGDIYPSGIVIGKIVGVSTDNFDLANILQMKSDVNFDNINYVTILKRNITK